jgi:hypothetical protein
MANRIKIGKKQKTAIRKANRTDEVTYSKKKTKKIRKGY